MHACSISFVQQILYSSVLVVNAMATLMHGGPGRFQILRSFSTISAVKLGQVHSKMCVEHVLVPPFIPRGGQRKPTSLATNRRRQKGGRAAVIPLGEVNPPPAPEGRAERVGFTGLMPNPHSKSPNLKAIICLRHLQISKSYFLDPLIVPPGGQHSPPGRPK